METHGDRVPLRAGRSRYLPQSVFHGVLGSNGRCVDTVGSTASTEA